MADVRRQLANTARAIASVGDVPELMQQLAELNNRRKALEAKLPSTDAEVVVQHPHAAGRYANLRGPVR